MAPHVCRSRIVALLAAGPKTSREIMQALGITAAEWKRDYHWLARNRVVATHLALKRTECTFGLTGLTIDEVVKAKKGRPANPDGTPYVTRDPSTDEIRAIREQMNAEHLAKRREPSKPARELTPVERYRREWRAMQRRAM